MKKLLTILLLIVLAAQASGYLPANLQEVSVLQQADDKTDKGAEEKKQKEFIPNTFFNNAAFSQKRIFSLYSCIPHLSPVSEQLTPPPDHALVF